MAWPCVTRACCIARFGNQNDKGDIAVPLIYTKYSEVTDGAQSTPRPGSAAIETQPSLASSYTGGKFPRGFSRKLDAARDSVMRQDYKAWKPNPEPSCKPRIEYQPSDAPLERETQYKKDYRSWPIPRHGDHPWIPKPIPGPIMPLTSNERKKDVLTPNVPPTETKINHMEQVESMEKMVPKASNTFSAGPEILISVVEESKQIKKNERFLVKSASTEPVKPRDTLGSLSQDQVKGGGGVGSSYRSELLVEKPSVQTSKPKKPPTSHKPVKKAKEKIIPTGRASKKKAPETSTTAKPEDKDKEKSKEINNKLAEAKENPVQPDNDVRLDNPNTGQCLELMK
ncbi:hypothetical protein GDO86_019550 [Hymenochirus boettgeri]|uniref:Microtubule-associated protein 6 n=1 Tax=Hymenochirus boettgeri TaxID=247094 RepID=A0A8T2IHM5_9PIPI|nr:hypothetical protein GDO86_019550 [Hymenochirus boettgeri]